MTRVPCGREGFIIAGEAARGLWGYRSLEDSESDEVGIRCAENGSGEGTCRSARLTGFDCSARLPTAAYAVHAGDSLEDCPSPACPPSPTRSISRHLPVSARAAQGGPEYIRARAVSGYDLEWRTGLGVRQVSASAICQCARAGTES